MRPHQQQWLTLALRRAARGSGSSASFLSRRTAMQPLPDLATILDPIPWVLVGGFALRAYMPERTTQDIDLLIHADDAAAARRALIAAGYTITGTLTIGGFTAERADAMPIDILTGSQSWLDRALAAPARDVAGYPVLARPYLMLLKLQAGRMQDLTDVQRMLRDTPRAERQATAAMIAALDHDLAEEFAALITLADLEFGPPADP